MLLRCAAFAALLAAGCWKEECHFGDPNAPLEAEIVVPGAGGVADLAAGAHLLLVRPPQFGRIVLVGVRARNLEGCGVTVNAALRDPCSGRVIGLEERPVTLTARGDGWGEPAQPDELSNFANVAVCPTAGARPVAGQPARLEVRVTDSRGRVIERAADVVPDCAGDGSCVDECAPYAAIDAAPGPTIDAGCP